MQNADEESEKIKATGASVASSRPSRGAASGATGPTASKGKRIDDVEDAGDDSEDNCHYCGHGGVVLICDVKGCTKVYHTYCLGYEPTDEEAFICPLHGCAICGIKDRGCDDRTGVELFKCSTCPTSYCAKHKPDDIAYRSITVAMSTPAIADDALANAFESEPAAHTPAKRDANDAISTVDAPIHEVDLTRANDGTLGEPVAAVSSETMTLSDTASSVVASQDGSRQSGTSTSTPTGDLAPATDAGEQAVNATQAQPVSASGSAATSPGSLEERPEAPGLAGDGGGGQQGARRTSRRAKRPRTSTDQPTGAGDGGNTSTAASGATTTVNSPGDSNDDSDGEGDGSGKEAVVVDGVGGDGDAAASGLQPPVAEDEAAGGRKRKRTGRSGRAVPPVHPLRTSLMQDELAEAPPSDTPTPLNTNLPPLPLPTPTNSGGSGVTATAASAASSIGDGGAAFSSPLAKPATGGAGGGSTRAKRELASLATIASPQASVAVAAASSAAPAVTAAAPVRARARNNELASLATSAVPPVSGPRIGGLAAAGGIAGASGGRTQPGYQCPNCACPTARVKFARVVEGMFAFVLSKTDLMSDSGEQGMNGLAKAVLAPLSDKNTAIQRLYIARGHTRRTLQLLRDDNEAATAGASGTSSSSGDAGDGDADMEAAADKDGGSDNKAAGHDAPVATAPALVDPATRGPPPSMSPIQQEVVMQCHRLDPILLARILCTGLDAYAVPAYPSCLSDILASVRACRYTSIAGVVADLKVMGITAGIVAGSITADNDNGGGAVASAGEQPQQPAVQAPPSWAVDDKGNLDDAAIHTGLARLPLPLLSTQPEPASSSSASHVLAAPVAATLKLSMREMDTTGGAYGGFSNEYDGYYRAAVTMVDVFERQLVHGKKYGKQMRELSALLSAAADELRATAPSTAASASSSTAPSVVAGGAVISSSSVTGPVSIHPGISMPESALPRLPLPSQSAMDDIMRQYARDAEPWSLEVPPKRVPDEQDQCLLPTPTPEYVAAQAAYDAAVLSRNAGWILSLVSSFGISAEDALARVLAARMSCTRPEAAWAHAPYVHGPRRSLAEWCDELGSASVSKRDRGRAIEEAVTKAASNRRKPILHGFGKDPNKFNSGDAALLGTTATGGAGGDQQAVGGAMQAMMMQYELGGGGGAAAAGGVDGGEGGDGGASGRASPVAGAGGDTSGEERGAAAGAASSTAQPDVKPPGRFTSLFNIAFEDQAKALLATHRAAATDPLEAGRRCVTFDTAAADGSGGGGAVFACFDHTIAGFASGPLAKFAGHEHRRHDRAMQLGLPLPESPSSRSGAIMMALQGDRTDRSDSAMGGSSSALMMGISGDGGAISPARLDIMLDSGETPQSSPNTKGVAAGAGAGGGGPGKGWKGHAGGGGGDETLPPGPFLSATQLALVDACIEWGRSYLGLKPIPRGSYGHREAGTPSPGLGRAGAGGSIGHAFGHYDHGVLSPQAVRHSGSGGGGPSPSLLNLHGARPQSVAYGVPAHPGLMHLHPHLHQHHLASPMHSGFHAPGSLAAAAAAVGGGGGAHQFLYPYPYPGMGQVPGAASASASAALQSLLASSIPTGADVSALAGIEDPEEVLKQLGLAPPSALATTAAASEAAAAGNDARPPISVAADDTSMAGNGDAAPPVPTEAIDADTIAPNEAAEAAADQPSAAPSLPASSSSSAAAVDGAGTSASAPSASAGASASISSDLAMEQTRYLVKALVLQQNRLIRQEATMGVMAGVLQQVAGQMQSMQARMEVLVERGVMHGDGGSNVPSKTAGAGPVRGGGGGGGRIADMDLDGGEVEVDAAWSEGDMKAIVQRMSTRDRQSALVLAELAPMDVDRTLDHLGDLLPPSEAEVTDVMDAMTKHMRRAIVTAGELRSAWTASRRALFSVPAQVDVEMRMRLRDDALAGELPVEGEYAGGDAASSSSSSSSGAGAASGRPLPHPTDPAYLSAMSNGVITLGDGRVVQEYHTANKSLRAHVRKLEIQLASAAAQAAQAGVQLDLDVPGLAQAARSSSPSPSSSGHLAPAAREAGLQVLEDDEAQTSTAADAGADMHA